MRNYLVTMTVLIVLLLTFVTVVDGAALGQSPPPPLPGPEADMPPLEGGSPYNLPVWSSRPDASDPQNGEATTLTIDVWYGTEQAFGQLGTPQSWLNILGSVSGPRPIESLTYTLNGGPAQTLALGSDERRLYDAGDFNIELDPTAVNPLPGTNAVVITADDGLDITATTVTLTYNASTTWPLPYLADWSAVSSVTEAGQVVDGLWRLSDGTLENVVPGFDRLVAIGDTSWTEYEVTVPVTVHTLNTEEWRGPSNGGGVGMIVRWPGHYNIAGEQPSLGWRHLGALGWYHWSPDGTAGFEIRGEGGQLVATRSDKKINLGVTYIFKMRVESVNGPTSPATYSFKFWEASQPEPAQWTLQAVGRTGEPNSGSVVLVAHQSEVSFGNALIVPLDFVGLTITVEPSEHGSVSVSPEKATYLPGEQVQIEALPDTGYRFAGWTGDLDGSENPRTVVLSGDLNIGATFEPDNYQVFISPVASGNVGGVPFLQGDILSYQPGGQWTHVLSASSGPFGRRSDVEAFSFMSDGSLLVVLGARQTVPGLGVVTPSDVLRLWPDANGNFGNGTVEIFLDGSVAGLSTIGERISALAVHPDGRLLISTVGVARVSNALGGTLVAQNEDIIGLAEQEGETITWDLVCDGSKVPGLAVEAIEGLSVDPVSGAYLLSTRNSFNVGGEQGVAQDVLSVSSCSATAEVELIWNSKSVGFPKNYDDFAYSIILPVNQGSIAP